jgi:dienelactone hydrolase
MTITFWMTGLLGGVAATGIAYAADRAVVACRFATATRRNPNRSALSPDARLDRVTLQPRGGHRALDAWHFVERPRNRVVIVLLGADGRLSEELHSHPSVLVARLRGQGFSVLVLNLQGRVGSAGANPKHRLKDSRAVLGAVDWLIDRGYNAGRIGVLGSSIGGAAAIAAAGVEPAIGAVATDRQVGSSEHGLDDHADEIVGFFDRSLARS